MQNGNEGSPSINPVLMRMFVTIKPYGTYCLSNFAYMYTHIKMLSSHRYTRADTDFLSTSICPPKYSKPCMHSMCLKSDLFNARPGGMQLNRCVSPSVRGYLVKMHITLETL